MQDVNTTDAPVLKEGAERSNYSFYLRKFRHKTTPGSGTGFESERVFARVRFGGIAERRENRSALAPVGKLIGVVAAAGLAGLARGDEQNGFIPVSGVCHKAHRWTVSFCGSTHAIKRSRLGLVGDAEEPLQHTFATKGMKHVQGVKAPPRPIFDAIALALFGQLGHREVGSGG